MSTVTPDHPGAPDEPVPRSHDARPPRLRAWLGVVLAERSRRGKIASWALAAVAAAVAAVVVWSFFPHSNAPRVTYSLGGDAAAAGSPDPLIVWPGVQIQVAGVRGSESTPIQLLLDRTQIGVAASAPDGSFRILARIPRGISAGDHRLSVLDTGTDRTLGRSDVQIRSGREAALWTLPAKATVGSTVAIVGGGFAPHSNIRVIWDSGSPDQSTLISRRIKSLGVFTAAVDIPEGATPGIHHVTAVSASGQDLAAPAAIVVDRAG